MWATVIGAAVGAIVGYLVFTERGQQFRRHLQPQIEGLLDEALKLQTTVERMSTAASDTWQSVSSALASGSAASDARRPAGPTH
jgi:hypothetical protein